MIRRDFFSAIGALPFLLLLSVMGCGGTTTCTVTGKLTTKGKPVCTGCINLMGPDGAIATGGIEEDGTFTVPNAPVGIVKVGVVSEKPQSFPASAIKLEPGQSPPPPAPNPLLAKWVPVDAKYSDPATSGKQITTKAGTNTINIDLE